MDDRPASSIKRPASKRGGKRPGAGAPKGNLNGLKSGQYSRQVKALKLALKAAPSTAALLHNLDAAGDNKRALFARALQHYAELILIGNPSAIQSIKTGQIDPAQIRDLLQNVESNQAIKQPRTAASGRTSNLEPQASSEASGRTSNLEPRASSDLLRPAESRHNRVIMASDSADQQTETPIRVLIAKPGLNGHDRGAKVVARALRDAGMEVIYTGIRQTPDMIAEAALQEDVQVVGLSILSGAHAELFPRVVAALKERGIDTDEILLFAGGIIPDDDIPALKALGFREIFRPGASTQDIIKYVREWSNKQRDDGAKGEAAGTP